MATNTPAANAPPAAVISTTAIRRSIGGSTQMESYTSGTFGFYNMTKFAVLNDIFMILKLSRVEKSIAPTLRELSLGVYIIKLFVEILSYLYVSKYSKRQNQSTLQPGTVILFVNWLKLLLSISVLSTSIYIDFISPFHNDVWNIISRVVSVIGYILQFFYILYIIKNLSKSTDELKTRIGVLARGTNKKKLDGNVRSNKKQKSGEVVSRSLNDNLQSVALNGNSAVVNG